MNSMSTARLQHLESGIRIGFLIPKYLSQKAGITGITKNHY